MPQFYFDTADGGLLLTDSAGISLHSVLEAQAHAMTLLLLNNMQIPTTVGEYRSYTVTVRDEADVLVCRLIMAVINDDLSSSVERILSPTPKF